MRASVLALAVVVAGGLFAAPASLQDLGPVGPSQYEAVEGWLKPFADDGFAFGGNSGVFAESPDRIFVLQRGETRLPDPVPPGFEGFVGSFGINALSGEGRTWQNIIFVVDGDGNLIEKWDQWDHLFEGNRRAGPAPDSDQPPTTPTAASGWSTRRATRSSSSRTTAASC